MPDEALAGLVSEEQVEAQVEPTVPEVQESLGDSDTFEQAPVEPPKKVLDLFESEEQARQALEQMAQRLNYYEQSTTVQEAAKREQEAAKAAQAKEEQAYRQHAAVYEKVNELLGKGKGDAAIALLSEHSAYIAEQRADELFEKKLAQLVQPAQWKQTYQQSQLGQEYPDLEEVAVALRQRGLEPQEIRYLFSTIRPSQGGKQAKLEAVKNRAVRDGFTEAPDSGSLPTQPQADASWEKKNKAAFNEWFGSRPKK